MKTQSPWWTNGVRFQCQGSGKCCLSRGEYGYVYLTLEDRRQLARHLGLKVQQFTRLYCDKTDGIYHLKEDKTRAECQFLKNNKCGVYESRPMQCRTWPFWPENMSAKAWNSEVVRFCPGVGKGAVVPVGDIELTLQAQEISTSRLGT